MKIEGTLIEKFDEQVISDKFKKREFVVQTADQYPQEILIQLTQDRTALIDLFEVGDQLTVSIIIRGRKWQKDESSEPRWFNTIEAWRIEGEAQGNDQPAPQQEAVEDEEEGELPF